LIGQRFGRWIVLAEAPKRPYGVYWKRHDNKWQAQICHNFHTYHLGYYSDVDSAISAYEAALARIDATGRMS
jgi:hypothetical protein